MSNSIRHICLSVRGALRWNKTRLKRLVRGDDGEYLSADDAREWLLDHLSEGHEVLPMGEPCEGFDYKTGCPGHTETGAARAAETSEATP